MSDLMSITSADGHVAVVNDAALGTCRALFVGTGGNVNVRVAGATVLYKNVPSGAILPVQASMVVGTSTTATDIVALY